MEHVIIDVNRKRPMYFSKDGGWTVFASRARTWKTYKGAERFVDIQINELGVWTPDMAWIIPK